MTWIEPAGAGSVLAVGDRIAAVDIGTNTVLLTVAERVESGGDLAGRLQVVGEEHAITRLGQGVDQRQRLSSEACQRTLDCLQSYRVKMGNLGAKRAVCVGTSALRDAEGGQEFLALARSILGCPVEVVSGAREAELTFRGAISGLSAGDVPDEDAIVAFDVGGGSTEIVLGTGRGEVRSAISVDVGSVRLFERHAHLPFTEAREALQALVPPPLSEQPGLVLGIAGTMTTLWSLVYDVPFDEGSARTRPLRSDVVARYARELYAMPLSERRTTLRIDEGRADVLPFGALVAAEVLRMLGASEVRVTSRGVRYGLLLEALAWN